MSCRRFRRRQRGIVLIVVVVCLVIAVALSVAAVGHIAAERRTEQANYRRLQASWLAEAGIERAAARLAADPEYVGETWAIPHGDFAEDCHGVVEIQVQAVDSHPQQRSVRVEADYRDTPEYHCRMVKQIVVDRDAILSQQSTEATDAGRPANGGSL